MQNSHYLIDFGLPGLVILLIIFAFLMLVNQASKDQPNNNILATIKFFIGTSLFIVALLITVSFAKFLISESINDKRVKGYGYSLGQRAQFAFNSGNNAQILEGEWRADWSVIDSANGNAETYQIIDKSTGETMPYPVDDVIIQVNENIISCRAFDRSLTDDYWLEGRISKDDVITLIYWSPIETPGSDLVGVIILKLKRGGVYDVMDGDWIGQTRDGKITIGKVNWRRPIK